MRQLDPKSVWLFFFNAAFGGIFMAFVVMSTFGLILLENVGSVEGQFWTELGGWTLGIILITLISMAVYAKLTYHFYRYELKDDGFHKEFGIIWKKYVTVPYDRIQNVDIYRGVLARILGLSDLRIQTAGYSVQAARPGVSAEGRLPGLSHVVAEQLRDELIKRTSQPKTKSQGL